MGGLAEFRRSQRMLLLAPLGAVGCSAALPLVQVALAFGYRGSDLRTGLWSLAATTVYLPLHLRHVWYAARGVRPPSGRWTLAGMAVVILVATPLAGAMWVRSYTALIVSAMLVLPGPWSYVVYGAVMLAVPPVSHTLGTPWDTAPWLVFSVMCGSMALLLLVWLPAALARLRTAREALAQQAVAQERRRIDAELRRTVGAALESIADRGHRLGSRLAQSGPPAAAEPREPAKSTEHAELADELAGLSADSRRALAETRRRVRGYRQPSLRAELETAAALLSAAGIATRLDLPRSGVPDTIAQPSRAALRAAITRLLRDHAARACTITVTSLGGRVRLELRADEAAEIVEVAS
ncbi:hypothetical protein IL992_33105 [Microbispora sp. NEAU-D428]|uniref:hypothetical protein n=1 Tax=Microbispora sitophila TaxID=2771537 RepID=UPI0018682642|nr:hypothetical protein [Microbispora sitophila]MBE3013984.1 hypothetical protein [Microbispora sitophila]